MDRRDFIINISLQGAWIALGLNSSAENFGIQKILRSPSDLLVELNPFILISRNGKVTIVNHKPEMGQGTFQSIPALIAEELEVDPDKIDVVQGGGQKKYGSQVVGGSGSVRFSYNSIRKTAATAREMLRRAAADRWKVNLHDCVAEDGKIHLRDSDQFFHYGELVEDASKITLDPPPEIKTPDKFKILGKSHPRKDVPLKVNGSAQFGIDVKVPGMLYASIEHAPVYLSTVSSFDDRAAQQVNGVKHIVKMDKQVLTHPWFGGVTCNEGVAIIADTYYAAITARKKINVTWSERVSDEFDTASIYQDYEQESKSVGESDFNKGDVSEIFNSNNNVVDAVYLTPYIAHATLEPQNATAHVQSDQCTIWAPTQVPDIVQGEFAKFLNLPIESVTVHVTFIGGGYGRRLLMDCILEAVMLSKIAKAPVKVLWTREDDLTQGPFRPGARNIVRACFSAQNKLLALHHKVVVPTLSAEKEPLPPAVTTDGINRLYQVENYKIECVLTSAPVAIGAFRSVYTSTNTFAHECFIDELAKFAKEDPFEFRKKLLVESARYVKLLDVLNEKSGWNVHGSGKGMAIVNAFGSFCGHVIYVNRKNNHVLIEKVVAVLDCGLTINPDNIKAQLEGNIVMALTAAVKGGITFSKGRVNEKNFDKYRMLRFNECPPIETYIIQSTEKPGGVGEVGFPSVAPALVNAVADLTGRRLRQLPVELLKTAKGAH